MDRFFLSRKEWGKEELILTGEEAHHCVRVMRKVVGDRLEIFDGEGGWARGAISAISKEDVQVKVEEQGKTPPLQPELVLGQAIPKGKNMELIVQKAVELGVAVIQPLITSHTVVRLDSKDAEKKRDKWQRIALEACKQCGQNYLPVVAAPLEMSFWLKEREHCEYSLMASLAEGARSTREVLREAAGKFPARVELLIGPEGDFSLEETEQALQVGFLPVTLGEIVLRVETATLYLVSAVRYEFGS